MTHPHVFALAPDDRHLLRAADQLWRPARELAERATVSRTVVVPTLSRLLAAGLIQQRRGASELEPPLYRRA